MKRQESNKGNKNFNKEGATVAKAFPLRNTMSEEDKTAHHLVLFNLICTRQSLVLNQEEETN
jgi:hypothetical protein